VTPPARTGAVAIDRSRLPEPAPSRLFHFPRIEKSSLPNGLRVWTLGHATIPVVTFMLLVRSGSAADPPGKDGLAALTLDMLDEGSGSRTAIDMHEALGRLGARLDSDIGSDAMLLGLTTLSWFTEPALGLSPTSPRVPRSTPILRASASSAAPFDSAADAPASPIARSCACCTATIRTAIRRSAAS
jgi:hypothetical protein